MEPVNRPLREALTLAQESAFPNWSEVKNSWLDALLQAEAFGLDFAVEPLGAALRCRDRLRFLRDAREAIRLLEGAPDRRQPTPYS